MELEITLRRRRAPKNAGPEDLLDYLLSVLGYRRPEIYRNILLMLLSSPMRSGEIAAPIGKRTTVLYHIQKLVSSGILIKRGSRYYLRENSFEQIVLDLKRDVDKIFGDLIDAARRIDKMLDRR